MRQSRAGHESSGSGSGAASRPRAVAIALLVVVIILVAGGLRTAYNHKTSPYPPAVRADALEYATYGFNLYEHRTFSAQKNVEVPEPDSWRSPGFPLLIAAGLWSVGESAAYFWVLKMHVAMGMLLVMMAVQMMLNAYQALQGS